MPIHMKKYLIIFQMLMFLLAFVIFAQEIRFRRTLKKSFACFADANSIDAQDIAQCADAFFSECGISFLNRISDEERNPNAKVALENLIIIRDALEAKTEGYSARELHLLDKLQECHIDEKIARFGGTLSIDAKTRSAAFESP